MSDLNDFCTRCQSTTPSKVVQHPSGTEFLCAVCGSQVDFLHADEPDEEIDTYDLYNPFGGADL